MTKDGDVKKNGGGMIVVMTLILPKKGGDGKEESPCYIEAKTLEAVVDRH